MGRWRTRANPAEDRGVDRAASRAWRERHSCHREHRPAAHPRDDGARSHQRDGYRSGATLRRGGFADRSTLYLAWRSQLRSPGPGGGAGSSLPRSPRRRTRRAARQRTVTEVDPLWYKDAIVYQLHIKSFRDSNADGFGDFRGLIERLDYIRQLGANTIWLLPFYPSPLKDDGYDIASYEEIHSTYGTIEHFRDFLGAAHERDIRVITELVINHTSDQHPWFQRARRAPKGPTEREWDVVSDDPK